MEVGRKNFKEVLPLVTASIDKAEFLAIDTELTGLMNGKVGTIFDTPEEYYLALSQGCSEFLLIQFGLCAFLWDEEKQVYTNEAYNFYLFPRGKPGPERMFLCQSSSLDFLSAQGFDFNKLIKEGISYMTEPIETKLRENLIERQKLYTKEKDAIEIPDDCKSFIEKTCKSVRQFIDENKADEIEFDKCNAFIRLLLIQEIKARFKEEVLVETKVLENKNRVLKVKRVKSQEDFKNHTLARIEKEWVEFEDAVGFSKVARIIGQSVRFLQVSASEGRGYSHSDDKQHEAGYDAFITGLCFLAMFKYIDKENCVAKSEKLEPFVNKLYLAKTAHEDSPYINLAGDDATPSRDHVFHLTFPKDWVRNDINQLFSPYGQVTVQFLTDTTALVGLSRPEQSRTVARALARNKHIALVPYNVYKGGKHSKKATSPTSSRAVIKEFPNTPESIYRKVTPTSVINTPRPAPRQSPEKVPRVRSDSATAAHEQTYRKRTSSGVFQVEESEPPAKKAELGRSNSDSGKKRSEIANGRKSVEKDPKVDVPGAVKELKIVEKFNIVATSKCAAAFKESDSWD
ncbi:hypothetical protein K1T71_007025 [Dendrolimus kikuchii]|uniref:Uncharacterized protein n=1 Tax=Dendrolimus kikuchii TaxID=765133 RepID=A0ACC1CZ95_9NEOP|nr:hypothetical protein K1T71_007025 [Dendrolimus kikuchii]